MKFEFNVGDLVLFKPSFGTKNGDRPRYESPIVCIIISKRFYNYDAAQYYNYDYGGEWLYSVHGSDGQEYHNCGEEDLKILATWIKP